MNDQISENQLPEFVFRVLSGSLNGIEFNLGAHPYFICTGDAKAEHGNLELAEHTLYIPASGPGQNFILNLDSLALDSESVEATISHADHQEEKQLKFNSVCEIGGIFFSLKREGDLWSEDVNRGILPSLELVKSEGHAGNDNKSQRKTRNFSGVARLLLTMIVIFGCVSFAGWSYFHQNSTPTTYQLYELVGDRPGYSVHFGEDNVNYLFASTLPQAEWAHQAIQRKNLGGTWRVVTPQAEETRLTYILERDNIAFYAIRFTDPENPTLLMSRNRNKTNDANLEHVTRLLLNALPYANSINIVLYDDKDVLSKAQQGLRALGFNYQTVQSESGVTLSSWMPSVDVHLTEFSRYVTQFYQTWGRRYVHFSADIHEDMLKEKSYKYGEDGYITMNKSHWLFEKKFE